MQNDRLLRFMLVFTLAFLAMSFFLPKPNNDTTSTNTITLTVEKSSVVMPNIPVLHVKNGTDKEISIDTCRDIRIERNLQTVSGLPKSFCHTVKVSSKGQEKLDLSALHEMFRSTGAYNFRLSQDGKDLGGVSVESETPGFLRTLFRNLFYAPIYNLFAFLISSTPGHSFGLAIILVTVAIRLVLLIPQHHILVNSKKMQAIQPKIKELQEKYKGDQAKIGMELMALYKAEQVNPLGSCLPLLIQMPLLLVLYWVVLGITDGANYYYLYSFLSDFDIAKIDTVFFGIHLLSVGGITGIVLALLVGGAQWLQIKLSLPKESDLQKLEKLEKKAILEKKWDKYEESEQESLMPDPTMMNKFMLWGMPAMIAVSTFFFPAGVGIYWLIGTLFMLAQQYVVNHFADNKGAKKR